jgi:hypothetical protein
MCSLPPELIRTVLSHLPASDLATCLLVSRDWNALGLPVLYNHVAIPPLVPRLYNDVRDAAAAHAPRTITGPVPNVFGDMLTRVQTEMLYDPETFELPLGHDLIVTPHHEYACHRDWALGLRVYVPVLNVLLDARGNVHQEQYDRERGSDRGSDTTCSVLARMRARVAVIHAAPLLYARVDVHVAFALAHPTAPEQVVLRCPPERATAGAGAKFEQSWAGAAGVLGLWEQLRIGIDPTVGGTGAGTKMGTGKKTEDEVEEEVDREAYPDRGSRLSLTLVFDAPAGQRWRPIPRPKDGSECGVPRWLARLVAGLEAGIGEKDKEGVGVNDEDEDQGKLTLTIVNAASALDVNNDDEETAAMADLRGLAPRLRFMDLRAWCDGEGRGLDI